MDCSNINREIFKAFKTRGLSLKADASKALSSILSREEDILGSLNDILAEVRERVDKHEITNTVIGKTCYLLLRFQLQITFPFLHPNNFHNQCKQILRP